MRISWPLGSFRSLVVGSRVANNLSSARIPAPVRVFKSVDFPAFVYPTIAATGIWLLLLCSLVTSRCFLTSFNSRFSCAIRLLIRRRSISSFFSPGPLVPIPPPSLDIALPQPVSLVCWYLSCASSTCILPSLVDALAAKISRMIRVLSITFTSSSSCRFFICAGDNSSSHTIPVARNSQIIFFNSSIFPFPT